MPSDVFAATQCKYSWTSELIGTNADGSAMTGDFILSTGDDAKRLTNATSPFPTRPAKFANKKGIALNSDGSCPSISIYAQNLSGNFKIYKNLTNCKKGTLTINKDCSPDLKGSKLSGDTSDSDANNSGVQFELSSSSDSECKYVRKVVSASNNKTQSATRDISIKPNGSNKVKGTCSTTIGHCTLSVDVPKKFYSNDKFTCPKYLYTKSDTYGKEGINVKIIVYDTGGENDTNRSTVDSNGNVVNKTYTNNATLDGLNQKYDSCSQLIDTETEGSFGWLLQKILNYIKIAGPILVVLLSALDFIKAIASSEEDAFKKAQSRLVIRLVAALALFLVPTFVELLLGLINGISDPSCGLK
jgi:hypothetical protein